MLGIVDLGICNSGSVQNMLRKIGVRSECLTQASEAAGVDGLILPGVGHFNTGMRRLRETGFADAILSAADAGRPVLGICLGMQLLGQWSEEGDIAGLGLMPARYVRFQPDRANMPIKVPHMGWNTVSPEPTKTINRGLTSNSRFYFVHSYHCETDRDDLVAMTTTYGYPFVSGMQEGKLVGVQFHPEKSHDFGKMVLRNFADMAGVNA
jgi:glutamine amidotransferase